MPAPVGSRAIDRLLAHKWPGNVRELQQVLTAAAVMASEGVIRAADLQLPSVRLLATKPTFPKCWICR